jgi:hypothetical protein
MLNNKKIAVAHRKLAVTDGAGIAKWHYFSVLEVSKTQEIVSKKGESAAKSKSKDVVWVTLYNPYGENWRTFKDEFGKTAIRGNGAGTFSMKMSEFKSTFTDLTIEK